MEWLRFAAKAFQFFFEILIFIPQYYFSRESRARRRIKKTKSKPLSAVKNGERIKLIGTAHALSKKVTAPVSNTECIYYKVEVQRSKYDFEEQIVDEYDGHTFRLNVNDLHVLINPDNSLGLLKQTKSVSSGVLGDAPAHLLNFLNAKGISAKSFGFNKSLWFREYRINEGDKVAVLGYANWFETNDGKRQLELKTGDLKPIIISNRKTALKK
jgi:preprotein translocase subunit YajC